MEIPLVDLRAQYFEIQEEIEAAMRGVIESTRFIGGPEIAGFESEFAQYCQCEHCVAVSSGTSALVLALQACGIGPGDEVVTATHTFVATAEAIVAVGARPVLVDVDPITYTMDPDQVLKAVTGRTRAILPVHIYGHPANLAPLQEICSRYKLFLIEDAAQAHGALYRNQRVGSLGHLACFSYYPGKNLGAYGDAGAVLTNDQDLALRLRMLANHGRHPDEKYEHRIVGLNHRMDAIQASILRVKLRHLDDWNARRRALAATYNDALANSGVVTPTSVTWATPVYHLYVIQLPPGRRDRVRNALKQRGVSTGVHYPIPVHLQPAFKSLGYARGDFPVAENLCERIISLPMYPELTTDQVQSIATCVRDTLLSA